MRIYPVPPIFQMPDTHHYPQDNWPDFEYWFMMNTPESELVYDRVYLPILFTSYFKMYSYGQDVTAVQRLQNFVDTLPKGLRYFCIVQYDDGTMIDWKGKDVMIFAMSGKPKECVPIPLVCQPHRFSFEEKKDIFVSFVGRITDPIRQVIVDWGMTESNKVYTSSSPHSLEQYCRILARSQYVLCPRGYGASSFRIAEAYQYGAKPIIIAREEDRIFPCPLSDIYTYYNFGMEDLMAMFSQLKRTPKRHHDPFMQEGRDLYSFEGVKKIIKQSLCEVI